MLDNTLRLTGNGEWVRAPIPAGADGSRCLVCSRGDWVILREGEGYEVVDGEAVFETPPGAGVIIQFSPAGGMRDAITAQDALDMILQAETYSRAVRLSADAILSNARQEVRAIVAGANNTIYDAVAEAKNSMGETIKSASAPLFNYRDEILREINKYMTRALADIDAAKRDAAASVAGHAADAHESARMADNSARAAENAADCARGCAASASAAATRAGDAEARTNAAVDAARKEMNEKISSAIGASARAAQTAEAVSAHLRRIAAAGITD